jgi:AcrR family transcriptional regulator
MIHESDGIVVHPEANVNIHDTGCFANGEVATVVTRRYTKRKRAAQEEETRRRIVEAAVELHEREGGNATVSAIARHAGVGRVTLYRHFPDELSLLSACTSHYLGLHPPPDLKRWAAVADPVERLERGLTESYAYHRATEQMMTAAEHEVAANPVLAELLEPQNAYWATAKCILASGWYGHGGAPPFVEEIIGLALSLPTWRTLTAQEGLSDAECVALFSASIRHLASQGVMAPSAAS